MDLLAQAKDIFHNMMTDGVALPASIIRIKARGLTAKEALGEPLRKDYPIQTGKEVMIEAECAGCIGQAFTDQPSNYVGTLNDILFLPLDSVSNRSLFIASLNAVLKKKRLVSRTVHCKNEEPEACASMLMEWLKKQIQEGQKIGLIGLQPAMLEKLSVTFGADSVLVSDLDPQNIGTEKWGVPVLDGKTQNTRVMDESDFVLVTGSSIVNGSFDGLYQHLQQSNKPFATFGNTIAGVAELLHIPRVCFKAS